MKFSQLAFSLENFCSALSGEPEIYEEFLEQDVKSPTIRSIEARMREALGRKPRPPRK